MLMDAADLYNQNGSFRVAHEYLDRSGQPWKQWGWKDPLKANWEIIRAETLTGQGYYRESLKIILDRLPYFAKRAIKQETVADGKGTEEPEDSGSRSHATLRSIRVH